MEGCGGCAVCYPGRGGGPPHRSRLLRRLAAAIADDADAVRGLILVENDPSSGWSIPWQLILAGKRLSEVAKKRYPGHGKPVHIWWDRAEEAARIDAAEVREGDTAAASGP
jgi:hypothetical protein